MYSLVLNSFSETQTTTEQKTVGSRSHNTSLIVTKKLSVFTKNYIIDVAEC